MPSRTLMAFQILVLLYMGIFGSWLMSSSRLMAFAALAPMLTLEGLRIIHELNQK